MQSLQQHLISYNTDDLRAKTFQQSGLQQSFSGSETDVSTSTENLTHEEKYVLRNSTREEPQGEETLGIEPNISLCNKSMDQSSCNTLIIHRQQNSGNGDLDSNISKLRMLQGSMSGPKVYYDHLANVYCLQDYTNMPNTSAQCVGQRRVSGNSAVQHYEENCAYYEPYAPTVVMGKENNGDGDTSHYHHHLPPFSYSFSGSYEQVPVQDITGIPKHYLDQSEILKHLANEVQGVKSPVGILAKNNDEMDTLLNKPPPPEYPLKWRNQKTGSLQSTPRAAEPKIISSEKLDKLSISRSQPDLSRLGLSHWEDNGIKSTYLSQRPKTRGRAAAENAGNEVSANQMLMMMERLAEENQNLKAELSLYHSKVSKLQKFEMEIQKVHQAHEDLVQSSEKRERLQHAIQMKLEIEIRRVQDINKNLRGHLDLLSKRQLHGDGTDVWKEITRKDAFAAQLIQQNKELVAAKERHEIELAAQRATLQEQRTHIDVLDKALSNAQANVVKLEEECRKKQICVEKVGQLQSALASLQFASDRREQVEKKLKNQLESEIKELRHELQASKDGSSSESYNSKMDSSSSIKDLKKILREKEERIITLEAEVSRWEQKYVEESALRQIAINVASMPKDAKIAALERTSQESEKLIAQARSEKLKQMDELHVVNKKCADLESRIKDLESKLAEKEAMIKVLQKHSLEKDVVYQNAMLRSPRHTPHSSIHTPSKITNSVIRGIDPAEQENSCIGSSDMTSKFMSFPTLTRSLSGPTLNRDGELEDSNGVPSLDMTSISRSTLSIGGGTASNSMTLPSKKKFEESKHSLDEQLKQLDSQLLNKDSIIQALRAEKEKYPNHYWRV